MNICELELLLDRMLGTSISAPSLSLPSWFKHNNNMGEGDGKHKKRKNMRIGEPNPDWKTEDYMKARLGVRRPRPLPSVPAGPSTYVYKMGG